MSPMPKRKEPKRNKVGRPASVVDGRQTTFRVAADLLARIRKRAHENRRTYSAELGLLLEAGIRAIDGDEQGGEHVST